jgi:hypothetical protein
MTGEASSVQWTDVERSFLDRSGRSDRYDGEKLPVVEVHNVYELGRIVALTFLEWVLANPTGVVALPTGRTPEFFIKTLDRYRTHWASAEVQSELTSHGFPALTCFPDTASLRFVMLDEFFPMLPTHRNSFVQYVHSFYTGPLNIKSENLLDFDLLARGVLTLEEMNLFESGDVDLTLLAREPTDDSERTKQVCIASLIYATYCFSSERLTTPLILDRQCCRECRTTVSRTRRKCKSGAASASFSAASVPTDTSHSIKSTATTTAAPGNLFHCALFDCLDSFADSLSDGRTDWSNSTTPLRLPRRVIWAASSALAVAQR